MSNESHIPEVAIVLLSYNSLPLVKQFLPKILDTTPQDKNHKVWLVDNASTDGTGEYVRQHYPDVNIYTIRENQGFTGGYSESLPHIPAKYYVLISSDIEVTEGWLEPSIDLLKSDENIAAVQPKVMSYDRRKEFEYAGAAGGFIDFLGFPFCRGRLVNAVEEDEGQYDTITEIFWASGACLFIKADLYHKSGGLDNDFFAHMEEIDLAWRLKNRGYKIMYQPASVIYHMGGYVIQYGSPAKIYRNHRNNLIMLLKNGDGGKLWWKIPFRFLLDYLAFVKMTLDGNPKASLAVVKAHRDFVWNFSKWYGKRKAVQQYVHNPNRYGICPKSLVWQFFALGKRKFTELKWNPDTDRC